jgi:hypothetical protein
MSRHKEADELARLRDTMLSLTSQLMAQDVLLTAIIVLLAREMGWRDVLGELAAHASDLIQEAALEGDEASALEIRDRALCLIEDRVDDLQRNFAGSECSPWQGNA